MLLGPIKYNISNYYLLYAYLVIVNLAFYWGYNRGTKYYKPSSSAIDFNVLSALLIFGFLLTLRRMSSMWDSRGLVFSLYSVVYALTNSGDLYHNTVVIEQASSSLWTFLDPIRWAAIPLGVANWKKLRKWLKVIVVLTIITEALAWLGIGTRKGLFDIIVITFFLLIANHQDWITNRIKKNKLITITLVVFGVFMVYFVVSTASRSGYNYNEINEAAVVQEIKPIYKDMPDWLLYSYCNITSYLCQGYYALSKGLEIGIRPITFGGSGWFTIMLMNKLGYDPEPDIYMVALEQFGIDRHINWHTIYLWLANDVSFIGVPFIIFIIGLLFARSWLDVIYGKNQVAYPFFSLMLIMVFYFYANNQVLSFSFVAFFFWLALYLHTRFSNVNGFFK